METCQMSRGGSGLPPRVARARDGAVPFAGVGRRGWGGGRNSARAADGATPRTACDGDGHGEPADAPQAEGDDGQSEMAEVGHAPAGEFALATATLAVAGFEHTQHIKVGSGTDARHAFTLG